MSKQKPAGDAQWTQQKANDRAAKREAVRQFEKFAKKQDPRTDFQKASDARHEAQSRSAAGKGLAVLPNTAGDPLALAAALTRAALDKCQPAWKAEPVAPARKVIPVADRKTVMPLEVSPDVRNQDADDPLPLFREFDISVLDHAGPTVKVMAGTWMGVGQAGATHAGTRDAYHTLTVANGDTIYVKFNTNTYAITILAGATMPSNNEHIGLYYRSLATVSIAAGVISITQYVWGPLEYTMRFNDRREFDVEPNIDGTSSVSVKGGTWMGAKGTGTDPLTRSEYFLLNVVNGDTVYVAYNSSSNILTYHAGATMPADAPESALFYAKIATITVTAGVVSVNQYRWGPIEHLPRQNGTYPLDDSSSSTAHTDEWYFYAPLDSSGNIRTGYNAVTWTGDRYYQTYTGPTNIGGTDFYEITTKVFSRTVTTDSNGSTSFISQEFLKETLVWLSFTTV